MGISHLISFIDNVTKYLNGSQDPSIAVSEAIKLSPDDDVAAARLKPKAKEVYEISGSILAIDINKQHVWVNCEHRNDYDEDTPDDLIHCVPPAKQARLK